MKRRVTKSQRRQVKAKLDHFERIAIKVYEPKIKRDRERALGALFDELKGRPVEQLPDLAYKKLKETYMKRILVDMCGQLGGEAAERIEKEFAPLQKKADGAWTTKLRVWADENIGEQITSIESTFAKAVQTKLRNLLDTMPEMGVEEQTRYLFENTTREMISEKWQARRIIQTESLAFMAEGERFSMMELGLDLLKMWVAAFNNTRPQHAAMHGTTIPMNDKFKMPNGDLMYGPHDMIGGSAENVINCSCGLIYTNK